MRVGGRCLAAWSWRRLRAKMLPSKPSAPKGDDAGKSTPPERARSGDGDPREATRNRFTSSGRSANEPQLLSERKRRVRRRRAIVVAVALVVACGASVPLTRAVIQEARKSDALRRRLDEKTKIVRNLGFEAQNDWLDVPSAGLVIHAGRDTCSAVIAVGENSPDPLPVSVQTERGGAVQANAGLVWCTCDPEKVSIKVDASSIARVAARWLAAKASAVGGAEVLSGTPMSSWTARVEPADLACSDAAFKVWSTTGQNGAIAAMGPTKIELAAKLVADGFEPVGLFLGDRAFAVLPALKDRCFFAFAAQPGTHFSLRSEDGKKLTPQRTGAIGWCSYGKTTTYSLWRQTRPSGDIAVVGAPADRLGGLVGMREASRREGMGDVLFAFEQGDLGSDAVAALRASTVPATSILTPDATGLAGKAEHTVVAFSLGATGAYLPEVNPAVATACLPELSAGELPRSFVCVEARPQVWQSDAAAKAQGAAEGRYPFWISVLTDTTDKDGLVAASSLLGFARRMNLAGFEPSTTDGVMDNSEGAVITGRPGKGDVVALGIVKQPPWIIPLTDGPAWQVDGLLRILNVPVGSTMKVLAKPSLGKDPNARRVVIWRR